jgi:hypothetical protein
LSAILRPTEEGLAGKAVATVDGDSTTQPTSRKLLRSVFDDAEAEIELLELMEPAREMARRLKDHPFQDFEDLTTTDLIMIVARCGLVIPNLMKAERLARGEPTVRAQPPSCATGDLLHRIALYSATFDRILAQTAAEESGSQVAV